jgi:hypothetical protein
MTWPSPEGPYFSSSRRNGLTKGANAITSNAEKFSPSTRLGSFPNCGMTNAYHWSIMEGASNNKLLLFSSRQD